MSASARPLPTSVDVLVVGAGISGVNAAYRLQTSTNKTYAVIEQRADVGGTWDLFKYPGIRSDSDMYTLGFPFAPWRKWNYVAEGREIYEYIRDTAKQFDLWDQIYFHTKLVSANFDSKTARWTAQVEVNGQKAEIVCQHLYAATGYYDYEEPHDANIPGLKDTFKGETIHPQFWNTKFDGAGKKVVVIGSGATAVTLVPSLAKYCKHVTMLQRSPTYYVALPRKDLLSNIISIILPPFIAHKITRVLWATKHLFFFNVCRAYPRAMKKILLTLIGRLLPQKSMLNPHFTPKYNPWDERVCMIPDGDFFTVLRSGKSSVETGHIETVKEDGILLKSGKFLPADVIVPATGLKLVMFGRAQLSVDSKPVKIGSTYVWKGFMLHDIPNLYFSFGYTNLSWSLGSDIAARHVCKVINKLDKTKRDYVYPSPEQADELEARPLMNLNSGYFQRSAPYIPKQAVYKDTGKHGPWYARTNWFVDFFTVGFDKLNDPTLQWKNATV